MCQEYLTSSNCGPVGTGGLVTSEDGAVLLELSLGSKFEITHRPKPARNKTRQPVAAGLVFFSFPTTGNTWPGRPQFGHEGATSETSLPQSGHLMSATFTPP